MRHIQFAIPILLFLGTALPAQEQAVANGKASAAQLEVTLAYNAVRSNGSTGASFWLQGGKGEFSAAFGRGFSLVGELAAQHVSNISSANDSLGLVSYLFGPRYSYRRHRRFAPFGQVLIGGVHGFDAYFPNPNGSAVTPDAFALAVGGGLNIGVSHRLAIRPVQADYFRTQLPNDEANHENSLRLGAGVVILIGSPK